MRKWQEVKHLELRVQKLGMLKSLIKNTTGYMNHLKKLEVQ